MRNSGLTEIPSRFFSSLIKLVMLDLGENPITQLPNQFSVGLTNTHVLYLDHCLLDFPADVDYDYQPFRGMKTLSMLFLSKNSISQFTPNLMVNLTQLSALHLNGNQLHTWEFGMTAYMPPYAAIAVSNNKIQFLPNQTFEEFSRIEAVDLSDNALICNCQVISLLFWQVEKRKSLNYFILLLLTTCLFSDCYGVLCFCVASQMVSKI